MNYFGLVLLGIFLETKSYAFEMMFFVIHIQCATIPENPATEQVSLNIFPLQLFCLDN